MSQKTEARSALAAKPIETFPSDRIPLAKIKEFTETRRFLKARPHLPIGIFLPGKREPLQTVAFTRYTAEFSKMLEDRVGANSSLSDGTLVDKFCAVFPLIVESVDELPVDEFLRQLTGTEEGKKPKQSAIKEALLGLAVADVFAILLYARTLLLGTEIELNWQCINNHANSDYKAGEYHDIAETEARLLRSPQLELTGLPQVLVPLGSGFTLDGQLITEALMRPLTLESLQSLKPGRTMSMRQIVEMTLVSFPQIPHDSVFAGTGLKSPTIRRAITDPQVMARLESAADKMSTFGVDTTISTKCRTCGVESDSAMGFADVARFLSSGVVTD